MKRSIKQAKLLFFVKIRSVPISANSSSPITISISGAYSGCGKTTIAERLLRGLKGSWGAIKYTRTGLYTSIIETPDIINQEDKDTSRLVKAGAKRVIWVQSTPDDISEVIYIAIDRLNEYDGIIVEGNAPVNIFDFNHKIFVFGEDINRFKESAKFPLSTAGIVFYSKTKSNVDLINNLYDLKDKKIFDFSKPFDSTEMNNLIEEININLISN